MADDDKMVSRHRHRSHRVVVPSRFDLSSLMPPRMEVMVTPEMAFHCFDVLTSKLEGTIPTLVVNIPGTSHPLFMTWSRLRGHQDEVLTSLGTFEPVPLAEGLKDLTIASVAKDAEFKRIAQGDMTDLQVTVAILYKFETKKHFLDWTVGVHGLQLTLTAGRDVGTRVANFLPEHPSRMGWTKVETIDALMLQAGFIGKITGDDRQALKVTRFQTQQISRNYEEFNQFRNWKTRNANGKGSAMAASAKSTRF